MSKIQKTTKRSAKRTSKRGTAKTLPKRTKASASKSAGKSRAKNANPTEGAKLIQASPENNSNEINDFDAASIYRARMQLVGGLLNTTFESVGSLDVDLPEGASDRSNEIINRAGRGAYMQIMGQVFAVLFDLSQAINTDDLVKLSRIVAEQRRAETGARKVEIATSSSADDRNPSRGDFNSDDVAGGRMGRLPESFGDIVRQVYGVSVSDSSGQSNGHGEKCER